MILFLTLDRHCHLERGHIACDAAHQEVPQLGTGVGLAKVGLWRWKPEWKARQRHSCRSSGDGRPSGPKVLSSAELIISVMLICQYLMFWQNLCDGLVIENCRHRRIPGRHQGFLSLLTF